MPTDLPMPTRGPVRVTCDAKTIYTGSEGQIRLDPGTLVIRGTDHRGIKDSIIVLCGHERFDEAIANANLVKAAFNSATAAADLGFDPIAAIEALPRLLEAAAMWEKLGWCASPGNGDNTTCGCDWHSMARALTAARTRKEAIE